MSANPVTNGKRWIPPSALKRSTQNQDERNDKIFRKVRGILNKLTPEKFDKLCLELLNVGIDSQIVLRGIILLIFEKALDEPKYSLLYAKLCHRLCEDTPDFEPDVSTSKTFKKLLLTKCQDEFENRARATLAFEDGPLSAEEEEQYALAKRKMLGNIKFIGELGKLEMVHESILHQCIKQLLAKKRGTVADAAEDLECLCQILKTVGHRLDHDKARPWMDKYFSRMESYRINKELPSRIRFMIQDVQELRNSNWIPRKILRDNAPKTIQQVHHEAAKDLGHALPPSPQPNIIPGFHQNVDIFGRPMNGYTGPSHGPNGPMSDMFGPGPTSPPVMGGIGTGPGVIPMDHPFQTGFHHRGRGRGYQNHVKTPVENNYHYRTNPDTDRKRNVYDDSSDEDDHGTSGDRPMYNGEGRGRGYYPGQQRGFYQPRGGRGENRGGYQGYTRGHGYPGQAPGHYSHAGPEDNNGGYIPRGGGPPRGGRGGYQDRGRGRGFYQNTGAAGNEHGYQGNGYTPYNNHQQNTGYRNNLQNNTQQQNVQKDIEKLPPRFRKQLEMQSKPSTPQSPPVDASPTMNGDRISPTTTPRGGASSPGLMGPPIPTGMGPGMSMMGPPVMGMSHGPPVEKPFFPYNNGPMPVNNGPLRMNSPVERGPSPHSGSNTDSPPPPPMHTNSYQRSPMKHDETGSISLRPVRMPAFRPNIPSMLPKSAQGAPVMNTQSFAARNTNSLFDDKVLTAIHGSSGKIVGPPPTNLTIKTVPAPEKHKEKKKNSVSQDELKQAMDKMLKDFLENNDTDEALNAVKAMKAPKRCIPELVTFLLLRSLDQSDTDRENIARLIQSLRQNCILDSEQFMEGFEQVLDQMKSLEADVPLVKSYVSKLAAHAIITETVTLSELSVPLRHGRHYPLYLLCLQQCHKLKDKQWLVTQFNESKVDLQTMLPECEQSRMVAILEDRGLSFLFPLLHIQADLWSQLQSDPNPSIVYKWIREHCDPALHTDPKFINIVYNNILRYIVSESTRQSESDVDSEPSKADIKKEKELIEKFKSMLASYIHTSIDLQLVAIYAVQTYCHSLGFPKGLLLRMFMNLYDFEVIDEDAFLKWKEDINEQYPGKGKALFQVNQWLTWLEQAESESSEDES